MSEQRVNFGSKMGAILATAGSAVGLGNVWRFPYMAGQEGGAAFILVYIGIIIRIIKLYADNQKCAYGNVNSTSGCIRG